MKLFLILFFIICNSAIAEDYSNVLIGDIETIEITASNDTVPSLENDAHLIIKEGYCFFVSVLDDGTLIYKYKFFIKGIQVGTATPTIHFKNKKTNLLIKDTHITIEVIPRHSEEARPP